MPKKLTQLKKDYYYYLDRGARNLAYKLINKKPVTKLMLSYISDLYDSAKCERNYANGKFETAYHNPISSELEFLIARTLYHYSNKKNLDWKILLRRQYQKTAPDIRITKDDKTIAIIEVKAKAGWIQPFFSQERVKKDMKKLRAGESDYDPRKHIEETKKQLDKYRKIYKITKDKIFVFLPTLTLVHRKKSNRIFDDYVNDFVKNSRLKNENLLILSKNLNLDLSPENKRKDYKPTKRFENFIKTI